jgi:glycosyltransferase involved in cell wall biosynthesis
VFDRHYLRHATVIHAASDLERGWIENYAGQGLPICVIPNGVELSQTVTAAPKPPSRVRQVLYLGRLHPLKGLDLLLDAWAQVSQPDEATGPWQLVIAGPDERGMRQRLENHARSLRLANVSFPGPLYGEHKNRALAEADLFILPSRSENFGIVVAEALAAGLPVITTKGTPWSEIQGKCGWWVEVSAQAIATALAEAMHCTDANRRDMGQRGLTFVTEKYQWPQVGSAMMNLYDDITSPRPGDSRG